MGDRRKMPTERAIRRHWRAWLADREGNFDAKEALCFACGMIEECERAHILARCDGGDDGVDNLHMLCRVCHKVSEGLSGDGYWLWLDSWTFRDRTMHELFAAGLPVASMMAAPEKDWTSLIAAVTDSRRRRTFQEQAAAARAEKAEQGGYAYGSPPFGFQAVEGELVPDPDEAPTLERIAELRGAGRSLREIARTLEEEGRPPKRGTRWHPESLRRICDRIEAAA